ncbi:MAG TPA: hypothetical protein VEF03_05705 [Candidatus Binataceae bacterium]|nr:hypothetical protein [Candidatus Binataceae bacterium]
MTIKTSRGDYKIAIAAPIERQADAVVATIAMERADGIEKIVLRARIANDLLAADANSDDSSSIIDRLGPWFARDFEMTRENALKSIRGERRIFEIAFNDANRGPFAP